MSEIQNKLASLNKISDVLSVNDVLDCSDILILNHFKDKNVLTTEDVDLIQTYGGKYVTQNTGTLSQAVSYVLNFIRDKTKNGIRAGTIHVNDEIYNRFLMDNGFEKNSKISIFHASIVPNKDIAKNDILVVGKVNSIDVRHCSYVLYYFKFTKIV